ncbi:MAG: RHS repeat domain-containing protein [Bacteriovoracia bacterium]
MIASSDDDSTVSKGPGKRNGRGRGHAYGPCDNPSNRGPRFNGNNGRSQDGCSGGSDDGGSDGGGTDGGTDGGTTGGTDGGGTDGGTDGGSTGGGTTGGYGDYSYNDNGELTSVSKDSGITTFSRDHLGQLKEVNVNSGKLISYALDWDGRRVAKSVDGIIFDRNIYEGSLQLSAVVAPDGSIKEYVYGTNINSPDYMKVGAVTYRLIKDHLGSPRLVVNASDGTISQRMDYNEWGEVLLDTNPGFQGFGFAGGLYDLDTKLVKFGARDYDGKIGRWLSKDPIRFNGGDTNLYGYVLNDPVNSLDPKGTVSQASAVACVAALAVGEAVDIIKNIQTAVRQQEEAERKLKALDKEAKNCSSSRKLEITKEKSDILNQYQKDSMANVLDVLTPGAGVQTAAALCVGFLATF